MSGGAYAALSGMKARLEDLDRLASDIANVGTSGYKTERGANFAAERPSFRSILDSAVDVTAGGSKLDFTSGTIASTGRDLDVAIEGDGFFVVNTPQGERYTRNGSLNRRTDGVLTSVDGSPLMGTSGEIKIGKGQVSVGEDGTIKVGDVVAGKLKIVRFAQESDIERETGTRFRAKTGVTPTAGDGKVIGGSLEQANVTMVDRIVTLTEVQRTFEALQRGVSTLMNEVDAKAISELGRR